MFKNWRTTLLGAITGGSISIDAIIKDGLTNGWKQALVGVAVILIGLFAKDSAVTGNGVNATSEVK